MALASSRPASSRLLSSPPASPSASSPSASSLSASSPPGALLWAVLRAAPLVLAGCSEGINDDGERTSAVTFDPSASSGASSGPGAPTTTAGTGTTAAGTTAGDEPTGSSTAAADTTGDEPTTGESTGPICDPGQGGCVCDSGTCVDGHVCEDGVCVPAAMECPGDIEPDDSDELTAKDMGSITDNDSDAFTISGILGGASDVDWYTYHAEDTFGFIAEPTVALQSGALRLCLFMACDAGGAVQTDVGCPEGSQFAISPNLRPGCCAATGFTIKDLNCSGQDESATIWLRVDKPVVDACTDYELKVNF